MFMSQEIQALMVTMGGMWITLISYAFVASGAFYSNFVNILFEAVKQK